MRDDADAVAVAGASPGGADATGSTGPGTSAVGASGTGAPAAATATAAAAEPTAALLPPADLAALRPVEAAALLASLDPDDVADDAALVEVVAAWQRVASWASAQAALAAGALAERASMNPTLPDVVGDATEPCIAGDELALRLAWSRRAATRLVTDGIAYRCALAWTGEALADGALSPQKARVLVDSLADQPLEVALAVQEAVLDAAPRLTPTQIRHRVADELLRIDPEAARSRQERARAERRLERPRMLPDGMAGVWAVLDAVDAVRVDNGIDAIARTARDAGDPRTLDQLRADLLVDLVLGRSCPGPDAAAGTGESAADAPAEGAGHEPVGGVPDAAEPCPVPSVDGRLPQRAVIHVTVPLSTLLGTSDEPGALAGHGPIHADAARALALGGTFRRLVTDPLSGAVLDVGRTRYRPPAALADLVRARAGTCVNPSCSVDASRCDLDHRVPFEDGGPTSERNLNPLCRHDHVLKTHAGHHLDRLADGRLVWRTPTGQAYEVATGPDAVPRHVPPTVRRPVTGATADAARTGVESLGPTAPRPTGPSAGGPPGVGPADTRPPGPRRPGTRSRGGGHPLAGQWSTDHTADGARARGPGPRPRPGDAGSPPPF